MNSNFEKRYQKKNGVNPSPSSSPTKKTTFSEAVVAKTDVGEFQEGYFIMSTADETLMRRPNINKNSSPQRKKYQQQSIPGTPQQFNEDTTTPSKPQKQQTQQQYTPKQTKNNNNEDTILLTPASLFVNDTDSCKKTNNSKSIKNGNNNNNSGYTKNNNNNNSSYSTSPPRSESPKKAYMTSPQSSSCWAGGAFNNSPAPTALPMPSFEDEWSSNSFDQSSTIDLKSMTTDLRRLLNIQSVAISQNTVA